MYVRTSVLCLCLHTYVWHIRAYVWVVCNELAIVCEMPVCEMSMCDSWHLCQPYTEVLMVRILHSNSLARYSRVGWVCDIVPWTLPHTWERDDTQETSGSAVNNQHILYHSAGGIDLVAVGEKLLCVLCESVDCPPDLWGSGFEVRWVRCMVWVMNQTILTPPPLCLSPFVFGKHGGRPERVSGVVARLCTVFEGRPLYTVVHV